MADILNLRGKNVNLRIQTTVVSTSSPQFLPSGQSGGDGEQNHQYAPNCPSIKTPSTEAFATRRVLCVLLEVRTCACIVKLAIL